MDKNDKISAVALVGGTHGNEITGVQLVKNWQKQARVADYPRFQLELMLANEAAIADNKRYLDKDLNRCFKRDQLDDPASGNGEQKLAKQINQMLGPKGDARVDFIIDLHTSTASMQTNIVLIKMDAFHLQLAAFLQQQLPDVVITSESQLMDDHHFLCSIAEKGIVVEVGPVPQGALEYKIYQQTELAVKKTLDFVNFYNDKNIPELPESVPVMSYFDKLYFPTDENGDFSAVVHPDLIRNDYSTLQQGQPVFKTFDGEDILYQGEDAHVAFVNEAAYYDQKIAICLCRPISYSLANCQPVTTATTA